MTPQGYHWHDNGHASYLVSGSVDDCVEEYCCGPKGEEVERLMSEVKTDSEVTARNWEAEADRLRAEVARLRGENAEQAEELADILAATKQTLSEVCADSTLDDRMHCTCIQPLRERIVELEAEISNNFTLAFAERAENIRLEAEVEMLRGVGCLEDGDGPCGACIKCARADVERLRGESAALSRELERWRHGGPVAWRVWNIDHGDEPDFILTAQADTTERYRKNGHRIDPLYFPETVEGDFVCPDSLALTEARAEVERLIAENNEWLESSERASKAAGKRANESMPEAVERLRALVPEGER